MNIFYSETPILSSTFYLELYCTMLSMIYNYDDFEKFKFNSFSDTIKYTDQPSEGCVLLYSKKRNEFLIQK